jgi:hypothetical protein
LKGGTRQQKERRRDLRFLGERQVDGTMMWSRETGRSDSADGTELLDAFLIPMRLKSKDHLSTFTLEILGVCFD